MEHTNRLIHEKSPYLLQHAHNPVDWYPWGPEAFERARREDKPIFLSVGYSSCYWCHVMERECFENEKIARMLNDDFVSIKVDREERPDIDQAYMNAVHALTGRGGWPMSVFLLPDGRPFSGGTYFPPDQFEAVLTHVAGRYRDSRTEVVSVAERVAASAQAASTIPGGDQQTELSRDLVLRATDELRDQFDAERGGFGTAPKFPPYNALALLLYESGRTGDRDLLAMATSTLEAMALGGIRDHIGGGFHRYSTDARWHVPHFEKMLYDNALLSRSYVKAYGITEDPLFRQVAEEVYAWVQREMMTGDGGFSTALDAESQGVEGKFYLWTRSEVLHVLGPGEGDAFCRVYNIEEGGNYREEATGRPTGENVPYLTQRISEQGSRSAAPPAGLDGNWATARGKLLAARDQRTHPRLDDKVLGAWNGLMIGSFARAGRVLGQPQYTAVAERAAEFVWEHVRRDGELLRRWREGEAKHPGYLDDHVFVADGLLELYDATGDTVWLAQAQQLMDEAVVKFWDDREGGFFYTSAEAEQLFVRLKDVFDQPLPSGNAIAAQVLMRLAAATGEQRYWDLAGRTLRALAPWMARAPRGTEALILAAATYLDSGPKGAEPPRADRSPAAVPSSTAVEEHPLRIEAVASQSQVSPGARFEIAVRLEIADGWHINSHEPRQEYLIPTAVEVPQGSPVTPGEIAYPDGELVSLADGAEPMSVYSGSVSFAVPLRLDPRAKPGPTTVNLVVRFQACDDSLCLAPQRVTLPVPLEVLG
jgi:uncharacterized protein YyaL (SSP411 family)